MTSKHGDTDERDVKIAIDDLITQKVQVAGVHPNVDQEVILVTEDKVRLCLASKFERAARGKHWTTIAGLIATLIMTLTTAQFRDFVGLSSQEWRGIAIAALIASVGWFIASLRWAFSTPKLDDIVRELKEGSRKIAREEQVVAVAGERDILLVEQRDFDTVESDRRSLWRFEYREPTRVPDDVMRVLGRAQAAFEQALGFPSNAADKFLSAKQIGNSARQSLHLGYAPDSWDYILTRLSKDHPAELMTHAGVITPRKSGNGFYDRFRNRLMVPIMSSRDTLVGFAGIVLDGSEPRILFSPESAFFKHHYAIEYLKSQPELRVITGL